MLLLIYQGVATPPPPPTTNGAVWGDGFRRKWPVRSASLAAQEVGGDTASIVGLVFDQIVGALAVQEVGRDVFEAFGATDLIEIMCATTETGHDRALCVGRVSWADDDRQIMEVLSMLKARRSVVRRKKRYDA